MGGKKGKKSKKSKKTDGDDEKKEDVEESKVELPSYGWIKITLRLCNSPTPQFNLFDVYMLSSQRVMMVHKKIVDHHGRIENIKVFNRDPTQFIAEAKAKEEARIKAQKEAERA